MNGLCSSILNLPLLLGVSTPIACRQKMWQNSQPLDTKCLRFRSHYGKKRGMKQATATTQKERISQWLAWRAKEDKRLYEKYGKPLEVEHKGEYAAMAHDGQVILGKSTIEAFPQAAEKFGTGKFALARSGYDALGRWLTIIA